MHGLVILFIGFYIAFVNSNDIICSADGLCRGKAINCNHNEDCRIICDGKDACWYSIIQCPIRGTCNIWCGLERNSCDAITINATYSASFYMYCADNECDDTTIYCPSKHYFATDHLCTLEGAKTLDRVTFYTKEGFSDINIENVALIASKVVCGDNEQYKCGINEAQTGCLVLNDNTCETYRLPTASPTESPSIAPTVPPTNIPTHSPTISPTINPTIYPTNAPTTTPTTAPTQTYDNIGQLLEFYIYYNDANGVNMILAKWMKEQLLATYDQYTGTSHNYSARIYNANTKWKMGGLLNMTFCVVFNVNYKKNNNLKQCQGFKEYGIDLNDATTFNTDYIAYGTFGIVSDQSIESFQSFVVDVMTSILFRQVYNGNMAQKIKTLGFDDIFQANTIKVIPYEYTRINSITNVSINNQNDLNIALGILLGILAALSCIVCVYCIRYYVFQTFKTAKKNEKPKSLEGGHQCKKGTRICTEQMNLQIVPRHSSTATAGFYDHGLFSSKRNSTINETVINNVSIHNLMDGDDHLYEKGDKYMDTGYYLAELQKTYLSSDADTNTDHDEKEEKLQSIAQEEPLSDIDSNDNRSVISSIISFGRRKSKSAKHKKNKSKSGKHKRSHTAEIKKQKQNKSQRKRSFHWGFTDAGDDIRYNRGENGIHRVSTENSDAHSHNVSHLKSHSAFAGHCRHDALPDIRYLEMLRKSSYHQYNPYLQFPNSCNSNLAFQPQPFNFNDGRNDRRNDEEFLAGLSPSMKSIEEMYASPTSPDGAQNCTTQSTTSTVGLTMLQETVSPPVTNQQIEAQKENQDIGKLEMNDTQTDGNDLQRVDNNQKQ